MRPNKPVRTTTFAEPDGELHSWQEVNAHPCTPPPSLFIKGREEGGGWGGGVV